MKESTQSGRGIGPGDPELTGTGQTGAAVADATPRFYVDFAMPMPIVESSRAFTQGVSG